MTGSGASTDPALRFWLGWAQAEGALHDATPDSALVVLPRPLQVALSLPEEISVTSDPEVAREDRAMLLTAGHPALDHATEQVIDRGDVGHVVLARPASMPPSPDVLLARARDAFPVDHGKIEPAGLPTVAHLPVLRVGALLTQSISLEDRFQERAEIWVDTATGMALSDEARDRLATSERADTQARPGFLPGELLTSAVHPDGTPSPLVAAHRLLEEGAAARRATLARETAESRAEELARTTAYFDAVLASIRTRRKTASAERRHLYDAREGATLAERARRLVEVEEKWQPHTDVRPFRLHVVWVPAQILPVHIRRGPRAYPVELRWLLPASSFLPLACPHCLRDPAGPGAASDVALIAGKQRLGCRRCLDRPAAAPPTPVPPTPSGRSARAQSGPTQPALVRLGGAAAGPNRGDSTHAGSAAGQSARQTARRTAASSAPPRGRPATGRLTTPVPAPSVRAPVALDAGRMAAAGEKLTFGLWQAVADGAARPLRRLLVSGSPLAALVAVFGARVPAGIIGVAPHEQLETVRSQPVEPQLAPPQAAWGVVVTTGAERQFTLRWELVDGRALATELIGVPWAVGHRLPRELAQTLFSCPPNAAPVPRGDLDPVADALCAAMRRGSVLPLLGRCLAAWERARQAPRLSGCAADVLAAAVHHQVARRAGSQLTYAQVVQIYGADDAAIRAAAKALQAVLALSETRVW